jgi:hypothetical protein
MLLLALGLITIVVLVVTNRGPEPVKTTIADLDNDIAEGKVDKLLIVGGNRVEGEYRGSDHGHKSNTFVVPSPRRSRTGGRSRSRPRAPTSTPATTRGTSATRCGCSCRGSWCWASSGS